MTACPFVPATGSNVRQGTRYALSGLACRPPRSLTGRVGADHRVGITTQ